VEFRKGNFEEEKKNQICSCHFNSLLAWIVQCQMKAQESHKAHTHFNTAPFFLGRARCHFIMARGIRGKWEQQGKKKDDL